MTTNQLKFHELRENQRHNRETEKAQAMQAEASKLQADVKQDLSTSEKFKNYADGVDKSTKAVKNVTDLFGNAIKMAMTIPW